MRVQIVSLICLIVTLVFTLLTPAPATPIIPGAEQDRPIAIVNATIHPVSRPTIASGTLLFSDGKIVFVGKERQLPKDTRVIDGLGKHVYPPLFCAGGRTGLVEINAVRATLDSDETGPINPNVKTQVAVNPDSALIPVTRANGVLLVLGEPSGGLISGRSAVLQLDGWTWEDLTLKADAGMHINWPRNAADDQRLQRLSEFFDQAVHYHQGRSKADPSTNAKVDGRGVDVRLEAMGAVLDGEVPLIVSANSIEQIEEAVAFASQRDLRLIIRGGYDAPDCARLLKQHDVPVIVTAVYRLPRRRDDAYDTAYTLPARLHAAGVQFCIAGVGRFHASNLRNLPYHAATAVAYGLDPDVAIKAITLFPAEILGVADRVGTLQPGRDASLIVTDGNPLDTETKVEHAFLQGREVILDSRHQALYRKYREKYRRRRLQP